MCPVNWRDAAARTGDEELAIVAVLLPRKPGWTIRSPGNYSAGLAPITEIGAADLGTFWIREGIQLRHGFSMPRNRAAGAIKVMAMKRLIVAPA